MPFDDAAPRPKRRIIWTGHPPVAEQIRDQRRSSGGMSYAPGGRLRALPPRVAARTQPPPADTRLRALLFLLQDLADGGRVLPPLAVIADRPALKVSMTEAEAMLQALSARRDIRLTRDASGRLESIHLIATGQTLMRPAPEGGA